MCFREKYKHTLPENWFAVILDYPQMFTIEEAISELKIIYPVSPTSLLSTDEVDNVTFSLSKTIVNERLNELALPWQQPHWNLYITNPVSTVEVWARIIGPEYSVSIIIINYRISN